MAESLVADRLRTAPGPLALFGGRRATTIAVALVALVVIVTIAGPRLWPIQYWTTDFDASSQGPSYTHPLGTDVLGRDLLARLMIGMRASLLIAVISQLLAVAIGLALGLIAGTGRRLSDSLVMRSIDVFMAVPDILLVILLVPLFGSALGNSRLSDLLAPLNDATSGGVGIVLAITLTTWMLTTRLVRAQVLALREMAFYRAAVVTGASRLRIMAVHLLPNVMPVVLTAFTLGIPRAVLMEAALSYLGLGLIAPMPSLGLLIADGVRVMRSHPTALVFPAALLCLLVIGISLLGDVVVDLVDSGQAFQLDEAA